MKRLVPAAISAAAALLCACNGNPPVKNASPWSDPSHGQKNVASGSDVELYFPLVDGKLYQYRGAEDDGQIALRVARVVRTDAKHGQLIYPDGTKRFEYTAEGVREIGSDGYLLKAPISLGTSWRGPHGGMTRIVSLTAAVDVPAGHFAQCLQTIEERLGDRPVRYATTLCPGVGIAVLEAASGNEGARFELSQYGDPVTIGPEGLTRVP